MQRWGSSRSPISETNRFAESVSSKQPLLIRNCKSHAKLAAERLACRSPGPVRRAPGPLRSCSIAIDADGVVKDAMASSNLQRELAWAILPCESRRSLRRCQNAFAPQDERLVISQFRRDSRTSSCVSLRLSRLPDGAVTARVRRPVRNADVWRGTEIRSSGVRIAGTSTFPVGSTSLAVAQPCDGPLRKTEGVPRLEFKRRQKQKPSPKQRRRKISNRETST
jgi:hypothetical protein